MKTTSPLQKLFNYWKHLTSGSTNRQIFGATVTVALMTLLVKVAAMVKELVVAWRFGTGDELDAFFIAFLVPSFVINVVAGSFNAALIPTYIRVREQEGMSAAQRLFSGVMVWSLGLLLVTTILIVGTAPLYLPLIARGFSTEKLNLTFYLLCAISPVVLVRGMVVIWGAVLNAGERFALAALSPSITPVITILFLIVSQSLGSYSLAFGLVFGGVLELVVLGLSLKRHHVSLKPRWYGFDENMRQVAGQYLPMIAGAFLMSSTGLVDQSMAAMLSPGSVATLNYGNKFVALILGLSSSLWIVILPYFSKIVANQDYSILSKILSVYILRIMIATIPITLFMIFSSNFLIKIFFQRGNFTIEDTQNVANILSTYALQIPFYISSILFMRLISSVQSSHYIFLLSCISLFTNILLNLVLIKYMGLIGISLSTSLVYLIVFIVSWFICNRIITRKIIELTN